MYLRETWRVKFGQDANGSGWALVAGSCEKGNKPFGFRKRRGVS